MTPKEQVCAVRSCVCPGTWPHVWPETSCAHPRMSRVGYGAHWSTCSWKARAHYWSWAPSSPIRVSRRPSRCLWSCSLTWADGLRWRSCSGPGRSWASDGNTGWSKGSSIRLPLLLYFSFIKLVVLRVKGEGNAWGLKRTRATLRTVHFAHYFSRLHQFISEFTQWCLKL